MLVVTLGFGTSLTATIQLQNPNYSHSVKGGLQTSQNHNSGMLAVSGKEENRDQETGKKINKVKFSSNCNKN